MFCWNMLEHAFQTFIMKRLINSTENVQTTLLVKCFKNVLSKTFFKPIFLNLHLQTCPNKDGGEQ